MKKSRSSSLTNSNAINKNSNSLDVVIETQVFLLVVLTDKIKSSLVKLIQYAHTETCPTHSQKAVGVIGSPFLNFRPTKFSGTVKEKHGGVRLRASVAYIAMLSS
jgi:hypothetical protein